MFVEEVGPVDQAEAEVVIRVHHQAHRIVRGVLTVEPGDPQVRAECFGAASRADRVVLEHEAGVEQLAATGLLQHLGQPEVLVAGECELLFLKLGQQIAQAIPGRQSQAHRQRGDEQADHGLHAGEFGGTAGHSDAEHHVGAPGHPAHHNAPCGLHQSVQRDSALPRDIHQPPGQITRNRNGDLVGHDWRPRRVRRRDQRRSVHPVEHLLPVPASVLSVLRGHPGQVVAVRHDRRQVDVLATGHVEREQLPCHQGNRPAIEHDVVVGQHEPVAVFSEAQQHEPEQRRASGVESPRPVGNGDPLNLGRQFRFIQCGQIMF